MRRIVPTHTSSPMRRALWRCALVGILLLSACGDIRGPQGDKGDKGDKGEPGSVGPVGPAGVPGSGLKEAYYCQVNNVVMNGFIFSLEHDVYKFADGSVMTTCEVIERSFENSNVSMYKAGTLATQGFCRVYDDFYTPSYGSFSFVLSMDGQTSVATYDDQGAPDNARTYTLHCKS